MNDKFGVGDLVTPVEGVQLASGCGYYYGAVVVSMDPFVLVSEEADMRWEHTVHPSNFNYYSKCPEDTFQKCLKRL